MKKSPKRPAGAIGFLEILICLGIVGKFHLWAVPVQDLPHADGDIAQQYDFILDSGMILGDELIRILPVSTAKRKIV